jgi:Ca-activated chloride channel family protein
MFRFAHNYALYFLLLLPLLVFIFILLRSNGKKAFKKFGDPQLIINLIPEYSKSRPVFKFVLLATALLFLILGIAGPQFGSKLTEVKRKGIEVIIALDVSNSMLSTDIQPSRLERAKQSISKLIDQMSKDKIGMVVFAGDAYTQLPITTDYISAKVFLDAIHTDMVPVQGTAIGKAIDLAASSFSPEEKSKKAIIVITDGENFEDDATGSASSASEKGIVVHTIGIGLPQGSPIPVPGNYGQQNFMKDKDGKVVISKLNEPLLQKVAAAGGGLYVRANNTSIGLNAIMDALDKLEKTEMESKVYSDYDDRFQYFIAIALILFFLEVIILERKNKWLSRFDIFKVKI